ncbi:hypothetical protein BJ508DRAFT_410634 [Ascobolus immersus RN42]|uniref:CENP-V/GFA domain-containing protein n=1 Tax=Ascobolus immersus RN42 TaxID=1160509 RepID=A0A3N4INP0_ASCIM|nr:hypothetical protein BJ508DRAFT_410634 [Ascobolus immersus RN42]
MSDDKFFSPTADPVTPDPTPLYGSCQCNRISYTVTPQPHQPRPSGRSYPIKMIDHCQSCRRAHGGLLTGWVISPPSFGRLNLTLDDGTVKEVTLLDVVDAYTATTKESITPSMKKYPGSSLAYYASSEGVIRNFCGDCGTSLTYIRDRREDEVREKVKAKIERGEELTEEDKKWKVAVFDFTMGSLHDESLERCKADSQWWWNHGVKWIKEWAVGMGDECVRCDVYPDGNDSAEKIVVKADLQKEGH